MSQEYEEYDEDERAAPSAPGGAPRWPALAAVAAGGVLGAEIRFGLGLAFPQPPGGWPWTTLLVNVSGCLLIGVLLTVLTELVGGHPLLRPLLGAGVLGGYTTFSAYAVDVLGLLDAGRAPAALGHLLVTPVAAVAACLLGIASTRRIAGTTAAGGPS